MAHRGVHSKSLELAGGDHAYLWNSKRCGRRFPIPGFQLSALLMRTVCGGLHSVPHPTRLIIELGTSTSQRTGARAIRDADSRRWVERTMAAAIGDSLWRTQYGMWYFAGGRWHYQDQTGRTPQVKQSNRGCLCRAKVRNSEMF